MVLCPFSVLAAALSRPWLASEFAQKKSGRTTAWIRVRVSDLEIRVSGLGIRVRGYADWGSGFREEG